MTGPDEKDTTVARIGPDHADAVWALYQQIQAQAPHGFLAQRQASDFAHILTGQAAGVAVGAFANGQLQGYSFSRLMAADHPLSRAFCFAPGTAFEGMGSAIGPQIAGRLVMARMLALRGQIETAKGGAHVVGLIDIANLASAANVLRSGGVLVGTRRDETSLNYVAYGGLWVQANSPEGAGTQVRATDLDAQRRLFAQGWAATGLRRSGDDHVFTFAPYGAAFGHLGATLTEV
jgi:hypothetical protein